jgi:hypothetical protein
MNSNPHRLRLGPLPRSESIKLTVNLPAELKTCLDEYAAAHSRVHGEAVDAATLIPHMLQSVIARDRGFKALRSRKAASAAAPAADAP